jgi:glycosyltransferase involved in cell wall biosynthesis
MKILYDHQIFSLQNYGGISRYFCELMTQFSKTPEIDFTLALRDSTNENLHNQPSLYPHWSNRGRWISRNRLIPRVQKIVPINLQKWLINNQAESIRLLRRQDFEIFHPTYYNPYFLDLLRGKPYVLTVYDMIHEQFPGYFPPDDPTARWKKQLIEQAGAIIAISESTKKDILTVTHVEPERISVIYLASSFPTAEYSPKNSPPVIQERKKPYLLFVGARGGYKNFDFFITTIANYLNQDKNLEVCCAGGGPFSADERGMLKSLDLDAKVHWVDATDQILPELYSNARAFVFPSLYEGFGLPALEAFSQGCPVIASTTSSLVEICDDAACFFDPNDPDSLIRALESVTYDDSFRETFVQKGLIRANDFSWEKTASQTRDVYRNVLDRR